MANSKRKGNAFEWDTCRRLSLWVTDGQDKTQLMPSRGSGGWEGKRHGDAPWRHVGDIAPNGPRGEAFRRRFAVECKHRKGIDLWHLWTQAPGENIRGWWRKLREEIAEAETGEFDIYPMLVVRSQNRPVICVLPLGVFPQTRHVTRLSMTGEDDFDIVLLADLVDCSPDWLGISE